MIVMGIDPGSRKTGFGFVEYSNSRLRYISSGIIRLSDKAPFVERLQEIYESIESLLLEYAPDQVSLEKVFVAKNADSALKLGHARGAAMVAVARAAKPLFEYEARKIKQTVVGTGSAKKEQVQQMVCALLQLPAAPSEDAADALAAAICHCHSQTGFSAQGVIGHFSRGRLK